MRLAAALVCTAVLSAAGCCTARPMQAPMPIEEFRSLQAARVERTAAITATGTLELRWRDAGGEHFESVEAQWWLERPESMALLLKKLGERMALAGRDRDEAWVIDLRPKPPQLRVITRGHEPAGWAQALLPMHLPWLLGVAPLPTAEPVLRLWLRSHSMNCAISTLRHIQAGKRSKPPSACSALLSGPCPFT